VKYSMIGVRGHLCNVIERWDACIEQFLVHAKLLAKETDVDIHCLRSECATER
jgi:hypothetical protein